MNDQDFNQLKEAAKAGPMTAKDMTAEIERIEAANREDPEGLTKEAPPVLNIEDVTKALTEALDDTGIEAPHWYTPNKGSVVLTYRETGIDEYAPAVVAMLDLSQQANLRKINPPQIPIFDGYRVSIVALEYGPQRVDVAAFAFVDFIPGVNVAYSEIGLHRETMAFNVTEVTPEDLARWAAAVTNYLLLWE